MNPPTPEQTLHKHKTKNFLVPVIFHWTSSVRLDPNFDVNQFFLPRSTYTTPRVSKQSVFIVMKCLKATVNFCSARKVKIKGVECCKGTGEGLNIFNLSVICILYCDPGKKFLFRWL